ncbi:MAG TPA: hypothetical protein VFL83_21180 [Anaeromyxobacter sp.]|nr:hypothetical protein [Anaeromyxobacter sp.]
MSLHIALALSALVASIVLFLSTSSRALAIVALVASGLEVAMALGLLHLSVARLPLGIVLGFALAVPGALAWLRTSAKTATSAAAIVAFVGALQVATALGRM